MSNIIRRLFFHNRLFLIATAALLCAFPFLTSAIVVSINLPTAFETFLVFAPPALRAIIEQTMVGGTAGGLLAFTWNHPVTHALLTAVGISFGARAVAGEIENGVIELILAQPLSRTRYLTAHVVFAIVSMSVIALCGLAGMLLGQTVFGIEWFHWRRMAELFVNVLLLQISFFALTLLFSSFGREAGRVASLSVLVAIVSFLINVLATMWNKAAFLKPYSLHSYYEPRAILVDGHLAASSVMVLGMFAVLATTAAFARFLTRDLP
jgi:ABC-2 type transport system permease protein